MPVACGAKDWDGDGGNQCHAFAEVAASSRRRRKPLCDDRGDELLQESWRWRPLASSVISERASCCRDQVTGSFGQTWELGWDAFRPCITHVLDTLDHQCHDMIVKSEHRPAHQITNLDII